MSEDRPRYPHDCADDVYLGTHPYSEFNGKVYVYDLYLHRSKCPRPLICIRWRPEPNACVTDIPSEALRDLAPQHPIIEGGRRAQERGLAHFFPEPITETDPC